MIIDGRAIANEIKGQLKEESGQRQTPPTLFIFSVDRDPVSEKFLSVKKRFAEDIGVKIEERRVDEGSDTLYLAGEIEKAASLDSPEILSKPSRGIIVQLPLPQDFDTERVLSAIPPYADPDVLSREAYMMFENGQSKILPPVAAAIAEILKRHGVVTKGKNVVIIGKGRLVGAPAAVWFSRQGAEVTILDSKTPDISAFTKNADIIVSGVGIANLVGPDIVKDGVVILDAATSEANGKIAGDADPRCAERASIFTPVPGGIGPVTVAMLFKNLLILTR